MRPLVANIDLRALQANLQRAKNFAPDSRNFAVIKADAYGHGSVTCAKALLDLADGFAVASVEEAIELRQGGIQKPLLVLSAFSQSEEVELLQQYQLMPVIHSQYQIELIDQFHDSGKSINAWLKLESGMNRLGLNAIDLPEIIEQFSNRPHLNLQGLMSHLACADDTRSLVTQHQTEEFLEHSQYHQQPLSLANSAAIMAWPKTRLDWNRPGIMLYGATPLEDSAQQAGKSDQQSLQAVMELKSKVINLKTLQKGQGIGYGHTYVSEKLMTIALIPCGYADGYPRAAKTGTPVWIAGQRVPLVGRVSMDSIIVDVTEIADVKVGDEVELWGKRLSVNEVASWAGTISYELLTQVSKRVPRVYHA